MHATMHLWWLDAMLTWRGIVCAITQKRKADIEVQCHLPTPHRKILVAQIREWLRDPDNSKKAPMGWLTTVHGTNIGVPSGYESLDINTVWNELATLPTMQKLFFSKRYKLHFDNGKHSEACREMAAAVHPFRIYRMQPTWLHSGPTTLGDQSDKADVVLDG
jgi:hypothetical protein